MAFQLDVLVSISVFDRLIDDAPREPSEPPITRAESLRRLRTSVRRDLEWLLNSRRIADPIDPRLVELNRSVYAYGLPDVSSMSLSNLAEQDRLLKGIERAISYFEPRLKDVRVIPVRDAAKEKMQRLDFRIEALLLMDPAPEAILFDTVLDAVSQSFRIKTEGVE